MFYSAGRLAINHYKTGKNSFMWIPYQVFCSPFKRRDIDISICVRAGTYLRKYTKRAHCILWRHWIKSVGTRWRKTAVILGACAHRTCGTWNKAEEKRSKVKRKTSGKSRLEVALPLVGSRVGEVLWRAQVSINLNFTVTRVPYCRRYNHQNHPINNSCRMWNVGRHHLSTQDYNTSQTSSSGI